MRRRTVVAGAAAAGGYAALQRLARAYGTPLAERHRTLPGDELCPRPQIVTTHAITIDAPPERVCPWLVDSFEAPRWMLWRTPTSTWAWQLVPLAGDRTRLVTRLRVAYDWRQPAGILLLELGDWPMMRRMLRGIRERAEDAHLRRVRAGEATA